MRYCRAERFIAIFVTALVAAIPVDAQSVLEPTQDQSPLLLARPFQTHGGVREVSSPFLKPQDPSQYRVTFSAGPSGGLAFSGTNGSMGMNLTPVDDALAEHLKLAKNVGIVVTWLDVHSMASLAGVRQNDVLLELESTPLAKPRDLETALKAAAEKPVSLGLLRNGKKIAIKIQPQIHVSFGPVNEQPPEYWLGISVGIVEPALAAQLGLAEKNGLIVLTVVADSPAAKSGVKPHDILLTLAGEKLTDQKKLTDLVQGKKEQTIALELIRGGQKQMIEVTPERHKVAVATVRRNLYAANSYNYDLVRPGVVWSTPPPLMETAAAKPIDPTISSRLDEMNAEIKQLKNAIEALSKSARALEEVAKSASTKK